MTYLTRKEAAARLGMSLPTLDLERSTGRLAYIQRKPGSKVWITEEALVEYLVRATHQARPEVSDTQAYKMLGNGWTVDVIAHILHYAPGITTEPLEVLSMYDGMSCGHLALDKLGAHISHYYATEIDKYAIKTTQTNFPDTIQLGDAFQVRDDGWKLLEGV